MSSTAQLLARQFPAGPTRDHDPDPVAMYQSRHGVDVRALWQSFGGGAPSRPAPPTVWPTVKQATGYRSTCRHEVFHALVAERLAPGCVKYIRAERPGETDENGWRGRTVFEDWATFTPDENARICAAGYAGQLLFDQEENARRRFQAGYEPFERFDSQSGYSRDLEDFCRARGYPLAGVDFLCLENSPAGRDFFATACELVREWEPEYELTQALKNFQELRPGLDVPGVEFRQMLREHAHGFYVPPE